MKKNIIAVIGALCIAAAVLSGCSRADKNWHQTAEGMQYLNGEGQFLTGMQEIGGKTYIFDANGIMRTGWLEMDGESYYLGEDGAMVTGWQEIGGRLFYLRSCGTRVTGWLSLEGQKYYLTPEGAAVGTHWVDDKFYLFNERGLLTSGWAEVSGKRYFADANCHPLTGWQLIDGQWYLFGEDNSACTGWVQRDGFSYYFTEDGSAASGYVTIDGQELAFSAKGQLIPLANPWHAIAEDYEVELANLGGGHMVALIAYEDYRQMIADCKLAGLDPVVCSSYRTWDYQKELYENRVYRFQLQGYSETEATELAGTVVAVPGTSEHQLGLALDIIDNNNWSLDESQAAMPTQQWLMEHSWEYGWILRYPDGTSESTGIIYEPWHYRYVGRETAADIHKSGLCLEDYLDALTK